MKNFIRTLCLAGLVAATVSCNCSGNEEAKKATDSKSDAAVVTENTVKKDTMNFNPADLPEEPVFDIETSLGTIKVKLYSKTPKHRDNFVKLVHEHFYDGLLFHRVINGFMIQGGDPLTKDPSKKSQYGTGVPDYTIPAEFVPEYTHRKGALAAARRGDAANPKKASSGSQFYIVQDEMNCASLDGEYTVFGETVEGLDVIDRIAAVATDSRDCPLNSVKIIRIYPDPEMLSAQEAAPAEEQ